MANKSSDHSIIAELLYYIGKISLANTENQSEINDLINKAIPVIDQASNEIDRLLKLRLTGEFKSRVNYLFGHLTGGRFQTGKDLFRHWRSKEDISEFFDKVFSLMVIQASQLLKKGLDKGHDIKEDVSYLGFLRRFAEVVDWETRKEWLNGEQREAYEQLRGRMEEAYHIQMKPMQLLQELLEQSKQNPLFQLLMRYKNLDEVAVEELVALTKLGRSNDEIVKAVEQFEQVGFRIPKAIRFRYQDLPQMSKSKLRSEFRNQMERVATINTDEEFARTWAIVDYIQEQLRKVREQEGSQPSDRKIQELLDEVLQAATPQWKSPLSENQQILQAAISELTEIAYQLRVGDAAINSVREQELRERAQQDPLIKLLLEYENQNQISVTELVKFKEALAQLDQSEIERITEVISQIDHAGIHVPEAIKLRYLEFPQQERSKSKILLRNRLKQLATDSIEEPAQAWATVDYLTEKLKEVLTIRDPEQFEQQVRERLVGILSQKKVFPFQGCSSLSQEQQNLYNAIFSLVLVGHKLQIKRKNFGIPSRHRLSNIVNQFKNLIILNEEFLNPQQKEQLEEARSQSENRSRRSIKQLPNPHKSDRPDGKFSEEIRFSERPYPI